MFFDVYRRPAPNDADACPQSTQCDSYQGDESGLGA
jgi:hypothetical protein